MIRALLSLLKPQATPGVPDLSSKSLDPPLTSYHLFLLIQGVLLIAIIVSFWLLFKA